MGIVISGTRLFADVDTKLAEELSRVTGIEYLRARNIARRLTYDQYSDIYGELEAYLGGASVESVLREGRVLDYRNGSFAEYMKLFRELAGRESSSGDGVSNLERFYSIESLKEALKKKSGDTTKRLKITTSKYRILNPGDGQAKGYLDSLIEGGEIIIGDQEHWGNANDKKSGARGLHILRKIQSQLTEACGEAGFQRPELRINYGQGVLTTDEAGKGTLRRLRDAAYRGNSERIENVGSL